MAKVTARGARELARMVRRGLPPDAPDDWSDYRAIRVLRSDGAILGRASWRGRYGRDGTAYRVVGRLPTEEPDRMIAYFVRYYADRGFSREEC